MNNLDDIITPTFNWLKEKGIDFKICSDRNPADKSIPRVEL